MKLPFADFRGTAYLDKVDPEAMTQNVAAYAAFAWMSLQAQGDFGRAAAPESKASP